MIKFTHFFIAGCFVTFSTLFSGCEKGTFTSNQRSVVITQNPQSFTDLLQVLRRSTVSSSIQSSLCVRNYKYFSKSETDKIWVVELQASNFGFQKAKAVISLTNGNLSFNIISYKYNPLVYRAGDITTYTGTTSVYDYQLKKLKDFNYENGQIKQTGLRNNRVDMLIAPSSPPPEPYTNWCSVIPALCDYTNEGGSSDEPFLLTQNPDGGSGGTSGDLPELANNPDANNNIDLNNNNIGGFDNTIYQAFDLATQTWPTIPNVIPKSDFVPLPNPYANCMTLAKLQLAKKLYQISDYLVPGQTI